MENAREKEPEISGLTIPKNLCYNVHEPMGE